MYRQSMIARYTPSTKISSSTFSFCRTRQSNIEKWICNMKSTHITFHKYGRHRALRSTPYSENIGPTKYRYMNTYIYANPLLTPLWYIYIYNTPINTPMSTYL